MIEDTDSIHKCLKETINRIPKKYKKKDRLNYISRQSFQQLAAIKIFNNDNSVFPDKVLPEEVIDDYILFNTTSLELENNQQSSSDYEIPKESFNKAYKKMENIFRTKNSLIEYDSLNPFENSQIQDIQTNRKILLKKLLQEKHEHETNLKRQDQQTILLDEENRNIDQNENEPNEEIIDKIQDQENNENLIEDEQINQESPIKAVQENQENLFQAVQKNERISIKTEQENQIEAEQENEEIPIQTEQESEENSIKAEQKNEENLNKIDQENKENLIETEQENEESSIKVEQENKESPIQAEQENEESSIKVEQKNEENPIKIDQESQIRANKENEIQNYNKIEPIIRDTNENIQNIESNQYQKEIEPNLRDDKQSQNQQTIITNFKEENQTHQDQIEDEHKQLKIDLNHSDISDDEQPNDERITDSIIFNSDTTKDETQINEENCFISKYNIVIKNIDQFFKLLYRIGYGHFALLSKELQIENKKEEISFYSTTVAVIVLFRLLPNEDDYGRYQNLILTLSNLFARFNLNMIRKKQRNDDNDFRKKEKKKMVKYNTFVKNSIDEAIARLEPFFVEYLKDANVEDILSILETRCAYDNWLLSNKNEKKIEIPFGLLKPSQFSQLDFEISSCLIGHKEFSEEMKPRLNDFTYLFTYLNIIDGPDKRIIINEWTKPEIKKIKAAFLNFGTSSVSTLQFIAKTAIITKSFRSISSIIDQIIDLLKQKSRTEKDSIDGFNDETLTRINFNTTIYDKMKMIIPIEKNNQFNSKEIEFMKLMLNNGILSFDDAFLDKKYNFKETRFSNFDEFVHFVVHSNE